MSFDDNLSAKTEPFDSFWEAPDDIEKGFDTFGKFYRRNYLKHIPNDKNIKILVISCGAGYLVNLMKKIGYLNILGIDSKSQKIDYAKKRKLNCRTERAGAFLEKNGEIFDLIFLEQEINHLTKTEILEFLQLCFKNMAEGGTLILHSLNGANPITGSEALAQNIDHYNTFTEYSLTQVLGHSGFSNIRGFPLNLYIFYENPANYVGMALNTLLNLIFKLSFVFYGKENKIFTKKIAAVCKK